MVGADQRRVANAMNTLPITDVDQAMLGRTSQFFQQIVNHDQNSTYWEDLDHSGTVPDVTGAALTDRIPLRERTPTPRTGLHRSLPPIRPQPRWR